jgi:hypothetical protein
MPSGWRRRVLRGSAPDPFWREPMAAVEAERRARRHSAQDATSAQGRPVRPLQGLGSNGAWGLIMACLGWRAVTTRREVGG